MAQGSFKSTNHCTSRSFLRASSQLFVHGPRTVNQSTQTDSTPTDSHDALTRDLSQCCGPAAVEAYQRGRPYCIGDIHFIDLLEAVTIASV